MLALLALAFAADKPVLVLPTGEDPAAWTAPATLAGFTLGPATDGARVELIESPTGCFLAARNGAGDENRVSIALPISAQAREDAAWLASSLLHSLPRALTTPGPGSRVLPPAAPTPHPPTPARPPSPASTGHGVTSPAPRPIAATPTPPAPRPIATATPPTPAPAPSADSTAAADLNPPAPTAAADLPAPTPSGDPNPPAPTAAAQPPAEPGCPQLPAVAQPDPSVPQRAPYHPRFWATAGPTVAWRADISLGAGADVTAGLRASDAVWLGLGARWLAPRTFPDIRSSVVEPTVDVYAGAWWSPVGRLAPLVGASGGASSRSYAQGTREIDRFLIPFGDVDAGARLRLGPRLDLMLAARLRADASVTLATLGDADPIALSPWELDGRLTLWGSLP